MICKQNSKWVEKVLRWLAFKSSGSDPSKTDPLLVSLSQCWPEKIVLFCQFLGPVHIPESCSESSLPSTGSPTFLYLLPSTQGLHLLLNTFICPHWASLYCIDKVKHTKIISQLTCDMTQKEKEWCQAERSMLSRTSSHRIHSFSWHQVSQGTNSHLHLL